MQSGWGLRDTQFQPETLQCMRSNTIGLMGAGGGEVTMHEERGLCK